LPTRTRVVLLQHPRERHVAIGTARMAMLCLPNSELHVGADWTDSPVLARILADATRPPALLFPGPGAIDIARDPPRGPITLVVVDGTWRQVRKVLLANPVLSALPRYAFEPPAPSEYRIRREPSASCVSTIEALAHVLGALEGEPERFTALLAPFRAMIDGQLEHRARAGLGPRGAEPHAITGAAMPMRRAPP
jgi:DTW domain-containing protein YfiP